MNYTNACDAVGLTNMEPCPNKQYTYFAYKEGQVVEFPSEKQAKAFSLLYDRKVCNQAEIDEWTARYTALSNSAFNIWYKHQADQYPQLTGKQFEICYDYAYDRGHHSGYDEVACILDDVVRFAERLLATVPVDK